MPQQPRQPGRQTAPRSTPPGIDRDEVILPLASGWSLRSGVHDPRDPAAFTGGEYVRLCRPDGDEHLYWDQEEWRDDPALVMGAILNAALTEPEN